jgi:taurine dioxygenase
LLEFAALYRLIGLSEEHEPGTGVMRRIDPEGITTQSGGVTVTRLGVNLGAGIGAVDLGRPLTDQSFSAILAALAEHEVLILRDQRISSDDLIRFGRRFGELSVHPFAPRDVETPELIKFHNDEATPPFGTDVWHSDETFRVEPPMATILCAKEVPAVGGDTVFASMSAAFAGLSARLQRFVSGLEAVHDIRPFRALFGDSEEDRATLRRYERLYPPQAHPVVRIHPVSGRKVLFVNPQFTVSIKNMDQHESRALLDILFQQALVPEYQFRLRWEPHTIAIWDNRSTQHYAVHDYYPQRRYMERVTIKGGPVVGVEAADPNEVRRAKFDTPASVDPYGGHKPRSAAR